MIASKGEGCGIEVRERAKCYAIRSIGEGVAANRADSETEMPIAKEKFEPHRGTLTQSEPSNWI